MQMTQPGTIWLIVVWIIQAISGDEIDRRFLFRRSQNITDITDEDNAYRPNIHRDLSVPTDNCAHPAPARSYFEQNVDCQYDGTIKDNHIETRLLNSRRRQKKPNRKPIRPKPKPGRIPKPRPTPKRTPPRNPIPQPTRKSIVNPIPIPKNKPNRSSRPTPTSNITNSTTEKERVTKSSQSMRDIVAPLNIKNNQITNNNHNHIEEVDSVTEKIHTETHSSTPNVENNESVSDEKFNH